MHLGREDSVHKGDVLCRDVRGGLDAEDAGLALAVPRRLRGPQVLLVQEAQHPGQGARQSRPIPRLPVTCR